MNVPTKHGVQVKLPDDYVLAPTEAIADDLISQGVLTPGMDQYGGADISIAVSGDGTNYVMFCAKKLSTGIFGAYIIDISHNNAEVPYSPFCTGRGEVNNAGRWIAWRDKDYFWGMIPGFAPHPTPVDYGLQLAALDARIAALEARPSGSSGTLSARYTEALERLCAWLGIR